MNFLKADNLAWFPHATLEEVLFIIKIADTKINGSGNDILHTFRKEMAKTDGSMSDDAMETECRKSADDSDSDVDPDDEDAIERLRSSCINKLTPTRSEGSREPLLD